MHSIKGDRVKYRSLSTFLSAIDILTFLAQVPEYPQYDLPKGLEKIGITKSYRTIFRHINKLEEMGLVRLVRTEPSAKGGKERKIYSITRGGLLHVLPIFLILKEDFARLLDSVAKNHGNLFPNLLGKWQFWEREGRKDVILSRMERGLRRLMDALPFFKIHEMMPYFEENVEQINVVTEALYEQLFTNIVLFSEEWETVGQFLEFLNILKKDEDLRQLTSSWFSDEVSRCMKQLAKMNGLENAWARILSGEQINEEWFTKPLSFEEGVKRIVDTPRGVLKSTNQEE